MAYGQQYGWQVPRQVEYVSGRQSAESYALQPNSSAILMDSGRDRFYLVKSDASGFRTVKAYDFSEAPDEAAMARDEMEALRASVEELRRDMEQIKGALL